MKKSIVFLLLLFSIAVQAQEVVLIPNINPSVRHLSQRLQGDTLLLHTERGITKVEFIGGKDTHTYYVDDTDIQLPTNYLRTGKYAVAVSSEGDLIMLNLAVKRLFKPDTLDMVKYDRKKVVIVVPYNISDGREFKPAYDSDTIYVKETRDEYKIRLREEQQ